MKITIHEGNSGVAFIDVRHNDCGFGLESPAFDIPELVQLTVNNIEHAQEDLIATWNDRHRSFNKLQRIRIASSRQWIAQEKDRHIFDAETGRIK